MTDVDAFWKRLRRVDKCWVWTGPVSKRGQALCGRRLGGRMVQGAQRVAWFLRHGEHPKGFLRQECSTPLCVRPEHWRDEPKKVSRLATRRRRIIDLADTGMCPREIAEEVGVSRATVRRTLAA